MAYQGEAHLDGQKVGSCPVLTKDQNETKMSKKQERAEFLHPDKNYNHRDPALNLIAHDD